MYPMLGDKSWAGKHQQNKIEFWLLIRPIAVVVPVSFDLLHKISDPLSQPVLWIVKVEDSGQVTRAHNSGQKKHYLEW